MGGTWEEVEVNKVAMCPGLGIGSFFVVDIMARYYSVRSYNIGCYYRYERNAKCLGATQITSV